MFLTINRYDADNALVSAGPQIFTKMAEADNLLKSYKPIEKLFDSRVKVMDLEELRKIKNAPKKVLIELQLWENYLKRSGHPFMAGKTISLADCSFFPTLAFVVHRGLALDRRRFPLLLAYMERMRAIPAVMESYPDGWEKPGTNLFIRVDKLSCPGPADVVGSC